MKKYLIILLAGLTLSLSACQQTPKEPVIINKNDGTLESILYGESSVAQKYSAPKTWTETLKNDNSLLRINIDASIFVPDVDLFPVYSVTPEDITKEKAENFVSACFENEKLYKLNNYRTKDVIMQEILTYRTEYDNPESYMNQALLKGSITQEEYDEQKAYDMEYYETELIPPLLEEYKTAPDDVDIEESDMEFELITIDGGIAGSDSWYELRGFSKSIDRSVYVKKDYDAGGGYGNAIKQVMTYFSGLTLNDIKNDLMSKWYYPYSKKHENLKNANMTYDEAALMVEDFVQNKMGYKNYKINIAGSLPHLPYNLSEKEKIELDLSGTLYDNLDESYCFVFTPEIDGIPILHYGEHKHSIDSYSGKTEWEDEFSPNLWGQHFVAVTVDNGNIINAVVSSSLAINEKINSNVPLLPFDKIKDIFKKHIFVSGNYNKMHEIDEVFTDSPDLHHDNPSVVDIDIDEIKLGYIKVRKKNGITTEGTLLPVWTFTGLQTNRYNDKSDTRIELDKNMSFSYDREYDNVFLCINAIDGSIIDLTKGY